ncbi:MAG: hypothetical protein FWE59_04170 [Oscillospiraceae bacterium]|nr:hypothetical protein [Oscillospiraceae bacterium]
MEDTRTLRKKERFTEQLLLWFYNNHLIELPELPVGLTRLECDENQLTKLPDLPYNLTHLSCCNNQITTLPESLPPGLLWLICGCNLLAELPGTLPSSLEKLLCYNNQLTKLPGLPFNLTTLKCSNNRLVELPDLPYSLTTLSCHSNRLTALPSLPYYLKNLNVWDNRLEALPELPYSLTECFCGYNRLTAIPALPAGLNKFSCDANRLTQLPELPTSLTWLSCSQNQLQELDVSGLSLKTLNCSYNNLPDPSAVKGFDGAWDGVDFIFYPQNATGPDDITASFTDPNFRAAVYAAVEKAAPDPIRAADTAEVTMLDVSDRDIQSLAGLEHFTGLVSLYCGGNQLTQLPEKLPDSLTCLFCGGNQLVKLPDDLPDGLEWLYCFDNPLVSLPTLPHSLLELSCGGDLLTKLPDLPEGLRGLYCNNNKLTSLPHLPDGLRWLSCDENRLAALPDRLPARLTSLYCSGNKLESLPRLPDGLVALYCCNNLLAKIPALPNDLAELDCDGNRLSHLPPLPISLVRLNCARNRLTGLDMSGLDWLVYVNCSYNHVSEPSAIIGLPPAKWNNVNFVYEPQPHPVDKSALETAIAAYETEPKPVGWTHNAYTKCLDIRDNEDVHQAQVDAAATLLNTLIPAVNLINNIDIWCRRFWELREADYAPPSWAIARDACHEAEIVCENRDATYASVSMAWNDLYHAITKLIFIPRLEPSPSQPGTIPLRAGQTYQIKLNTNLPSLRYTSSSTSVTSSDTGLLVGVKAGASIVTVSLSSAPGLVLRFLVTCFD